MQIRKLQSETCAVDARKKASQREKRRIRQKRKPIHGAHLPDAKADGAREFLVSFLEAARSIFSFWIRASMPPRRQTIIIPLFGTPRRAAQKKSGGE